MRRHRPLPSSLAALPIAVLFCGACLCVASARAAEPVPDHTLGAAAWPGLEADTRAMIEVMARDLYVEVGGVREGYDGLPELRKAALRGQAMRRLGMDAGALAEGWV